MLRRWTLAVTATALLLVPAAAAVGQSGVDGSYNCSDFASATELSEALADGTANAEADGLDGDGDGWACESQFPPDGVQVDQPPDPEASQPSDPSPSPEDGTDDGQVQTPTRVDTGGGYCATHTDCQGRSG